MPSDKMWARKHELDELRRRFDSSDVITIDIGGEERKLYPAKDSWGGFIESLCTARDDAIRRKCYVGVYTHRNDWEPTGLRYLIMSLNKRYKYELIV